MLGFDSKLVVKGYFCSQDISPSAFVVHEVHRQTRDRIILVRNYDPEFRQIYQFQVVGRKRPTESEAQPPLYRMRLFARNKVLAVSKFWYLLKKMKKVKKSRGEILAVNELREKRPTYVKNFGIWLRYDSRTGTHNMYKEIRDVSQNGAVSQLYAEMAGRHRALPSNIQIIRVAQLKASQCRRPHMLQLFDSKLKLPAIRRIFPTPKNKKTVFCARKPTLFLR
eukprot:XP_023973716.1 60S ribosomal protein L18a-1-like [Physeter catodon]